MPINNKINPYTNKGGRGWWSPHCKYSAGVEVGNVCGGVAGGYHQSHAHQIQQSLQEFHGRLTKTLQGFNKTLVANSAFKQRLQVKQKHTCEYITECKAALLRSLEN